jgi:lipopolysaccharide/colanic/teichoic acid biosynthesis glycosyltransferase
MRRWAYLACKRVLDVVGALVGIVLASPVLLVAVVAVRRQMGSPVLFRHVRAGQHGTPFALLKLRTMRPLRPGEDQFSSDGARLTPLGATLRSWSIDEIPQLVNVLRGEMSLVGPRPLPREYLRRYGSSQRRRLKVRPGITGWAQVNGRNAVGWSERFALDAWYADNASLLLDLRILLRTLRLVLWRSGVTADGHATMPEFRPPLAALDMARAWPDRVQRAPHAVSRWVGGSVVVVLPEHDEPLLLSGVGSWLWDQLDEAQDTAGLRATLDDIAPPQDDSAAERLRTAIDHLQRAGAVVAA